MVALADLLTSPTGRKALFQRDIAQVFRILRDAGVSQANIAVATGQKQSRSPRSSPAVRCSRWLCSNGSQTDWECPGAGWGWHTSLTWHR
jgi:hypothetical protein